MPSFQTSPGTRDILPPEADRWRAFTDLFSATVGSAGYRFFVPPMFEDLGVFLRLGDATDVVTKEMYDFEDKGGRRVALRPEHTAGVCRAFVQHRPVEPWKIWYSGSNFRYEKPQAGRYRQFDQVGIEVLGPDDPMLDVEVISLAWDFFAALGLRGVELRINSLGDAGDRHRYADVLARHFGEHRATMSAAAVETLERNPLRVLDSKRPEDAAAVASAPSMRDHLSPAAAEHFARVTEGLAAIGIPHRIDDRLVRGLDYYRRTTFEFASSALAGAQDAIGGGGRYDGLVADLGGPETPGVGFALGVDRTLLACDAEGCFAAPTGDVEVFVVDTTGGAVALRLTRELRLAGRSVDRAWDQRSMKAQMKAADRSGARVAVIVGTDEAAAGECIVRSLGDSRQTTIAQSALASHLDEVLGAPARRKDTR